MEAIDHNQHIYVEVDGKQLSEYSTFTEAIKAGLELKKNSPQSKIRVHETEEQPALNRID